MLTPYLIQRGTIKPEIVKEYLNIPEEDRFSRFHRPLTGREGIISLDYMGSAEFEFGAIPASFARIMSNYKEYAIFKSRLRTKNGVIVWVYCPRFKHDVVETWLERVAEKDILHLKEYIGFLDALNVQPGTERVCDDNFWWDIENDIMFWIGMEDYANAVLATISNDYYNWWTEMPQDTRESKLQDATSGLHGHYWRWTEELSKL